MWGRNLTSGGLKCRGVDAHTKYEICQMIFPRVASPRRPGGSTIIMSGICVRARLCAGVCAGMCVENQL